MHRLWWPEPLYELKPYAALALGLLAGLVGTVRSWAAQAWDAIFALTVLSGMAGVLYAVTIFRMRHAYRSRSRWNRERRR